MINVTVVIGGERLDEGSVATEDLEHRLRDGGVDAEAGRQHDGVRTLRAGEAGRLRRPAAVLPRLVARRSAAAAPSRPGPPGRASRAIPETVRERPDEANVEAVAEALACLSPASHDVLRTRTTIASWTPQSDLSASIPS